MNSCCFILVYLLHQIYASSETHYECGAHGKFEYCVDGDPGCVVGCHCHPGYYFDTDTKVCEPNIKLTQFRRQFNPMYESEPTRVPMMNYEYATLPKLTTLNPVDTKVEEIAKDTDDLGDWLYNQFFKTIENQVINNTNSEVKTRRSGGGPVKPKRRSHKKNKRYKSKRKKKKRRGLKSKLLRISEDDSLFDSSSSSSSDESDSTSSEESGSASGSDSSSDHDHRKILMINKKPTPPLPSFIFLPNMETPYYPPIGLPAPPILQMYPMVPVPPMGAVICDSTAAPTSTTSSPSSTTTAVTSETTSENEATTTEANPEDTGATESNDAPAARVGTQSERNNKMGHRNKFLQKIRDKMKRRNKRPPVPNVMEEFQDPGGPIVHENDEQSMEHPLRTNKGLPKLEDVDFKYLTQLIHKIDLNKTSPLDLPPFNPMLNYPEVEGLSPLLQRRNYQNAPHYLNKQNYGNLIPSYENSMPLTYAQINHKSRPASKADDMNDAYYTSLGKEIASLIRNIDDKGEHVIDIELQHQNALQPVGLINGNRLAPGRSYWERFVRSPLNNLIPFFKKIDSRRHSGENLVDIENKVNVATAIERSFNLQELETMANIMALAKLTANGHQNRGTERSTMRTSTNPIYDFKFNLLPETIRRNNPIVHESAIGDKDNVMNQEELSEVRNQHYQKFVRRLPPKFSPLNLNNKTEMLNNRTRHVGDTINMNSLKNLLRAQNYQTPLQHQVSRIVLVERNITNPLTAQQLAKYDVKPALLNYRNVNFMNNNHNRNKFHAQRSLIPIQMPQHAVPNHMANLVRPSYFHHQLHHFDYFD